jgi:hypothetical protein
MVDLSIVLSFDHPLIARLTRIFNNKVPRNPTKQALTRSIKCIINALITALVLSTPTNKNPRTHPASRSPVLPGALNGSITEKSANVEPIAVCITDTSISKLTMIIWNRKMEEILHGNVDTSNSAWVLRFLALTILS